MVVVETIIASVYLLSIIIKIGSGTDYDYKESRVGCEGAELQGQNWVLWKSQWPPVSPWFFCVPSSASEAWIHRLL